MERHAKLTTINSKKSRRFVMKNTKSERKDEKVIPFPNLAQLLLKKGMQAMEEKKFKNARELFGQAYELEPEDEDINIGLALSLVELGNYQDAKAIVNKMMGNGIGEYFHVINIYLMILLQLNEHREIISVVEALLEENQVPEGRVESLEHLLAMSKRIVEQGSEQEYSDDFPEFKVESPQIQEEEIKVILETGTMQEQFFMLSSLAGQNIRPWVGLLCQYLIEEKHPFLKTFTLSILKEQEVDKIVEVDKFGQTITVNIVDLPIVEETHFLSDIHKTLRDRLENNNPIMFEQAMEMVKRHNILLYPLNIPNLEGWAEGYYRIVSEAYGIDLKEPDERINIIIEEIRNLEGMTFPVI